MKIHLPILGVVLSVLALSCPGIRARAQDAPHEDLNACPGSAPEPSQSDTWSVEFCNRTGHDIVIEFHDNDCPARDWGRRGDVYQRTLRRGESKSLPMCYANQPLGKKPAPGTPTLRIPGGKGVTTTWSVVGDCGDRSKPLNLDARTFYDRGEYKTGIILLQYPSGASHCTSDAYAAASAPAANAVATPDSDAITGAPSAAAVPSAARSAVAAHPTIVTPLAAPAAPAVPRTTGPPTLSAVVDKTGLIQHIVLVYAKGGAGYKCNFNLALIFSDGTTWNDRTKVDITGTDEQVPIATRKYLKTPTDVTMTSNTCAPR